MGVSTRVRERRCRRFDDGHQRCSGSAAHRAARAHVAEDDRSPSSPGPTLIANVVIVVTGGAVRLTASGLGCPTWPECSTGAFIAHPSLGVHGAIEFGNRLLTFVLVGIVLATFVVAWFVRRPSRADRTVRWLTVAVALTIPLQAVLGGITVLTHLNPWVVSAHFLFSMAIIALCTVLVRRVAWPSLRTREPLTSVRRLRVAAGHRHRASSSPRARSSPGAGPTPAIWTRSGTDCPRLRSSQLHADLVFLLLGVTIGALLVGRAADRPWVARPALRAARSSSPSRPSSGSSSTSPDSPSRSSTCTCWVRRCSPPPPPTSCCGRDAGLPGDQRPHRTRQPGGPASEQAVTPRHASAASNGSVGPARDTLAGSAVRGCRHHPRLRDQHGRTRQPVPVREAQLGESFGPRGCADGERDPRRRHEGRRHPLRPRGRHRPDVGLSAIRSHGRRE